MKRIRKVKTLAYIIGYLKSQMPSLMGKEKKQQKLIADLPNVFRTILKKYSLAPGDFPVSTEYSPLHPINLAFKSPSHRPLFLCTYITEKDITSFSAKLREVKFAEFSTLSEKQISALDDILNTDIPQLMEVRYLHFPNCL